MQTNKNNFVARAPQQTSKPVCIAPNRCTPRPTHPYPQAMHTYVPRVRAQGGECVGHERADSRSPHTSLISTAKEGGAAAKGGSGKGRASAALGAGGGRGLERGTCHQGHYKEGVGKHREAKHCLFGCWLVCLLLICEGGAGCVREREEVVEGQGAFA